MTINTIILERLIEYFPSDSCEWWESDGPVGIFDVMFSKASLIDSPYAFELGYKLENDDKGREVNRDWHIGRFKYLSTLEKIDPIELDNDCSGGMVYPIPIIIDGFHRLLSRMVRGDKTIKIIYSGRLDLLRYLQGKRKTKPEC